MAGEFDSGFDGIITEIPDISVDNFTKEAQKAYFLSHVPADRKRGLFDKETCERLLNNGAKVYMSPDTKTILSHMLAHFTEIEQLILALEIEKNHHRIDVSKDEPSEIFVSLIPVEHVVGAVMFLFKTSKVDKPNTILYTGDFVANGEETKTLKRLLDLDESSLDAVYVDSTFNSKKDYEAFPTREEGHEAVVAKVKEWLNRNATGRVLLLTHYDFGYEDIYKALNEQLHLKTYVESPEPYFYQMYIDLYGDENPITNDSNSKIHVKVIDENCHFQPPGDVIYLTIDISAMRGCFYDPKKHRALTRHGDNSYYLCYPTHCSRSQLRNFLPNIVHTPFPKCPKQASEENKRLSPYRFNISFHGYIDEIPGIAVDNFTNKIRTAYFLSHVHSDHTVGLLDSEPRLQKIYMSSQSKIILKTMNPKDWHFIENSVIFLEEGTTHHIQLSNDRTIAVTLIPAHHMIGAVMFLFRTENKTILYTGDFVLDGKETNALNKELKMTDGTLSKLDAMYIDSTFDSEDYKAFPTQEECHKAIVKKVKDFLDTDDTGKVYLGSYYNLGYEDIYKALHNELKIKIHAKESLVEVFEALFADNPMTKDSNNNQISVVRANCKPLDSKRFLRIDFSASCGYDPGSHEALTPTSNNTNPNGQFHHLCYPTHCSKSQLEEFKRRFPSQRTVSFPEVPKPANWDSSPYKPLPVDDITALMSSASLN